MNKKKICWLATGGTIASRPSANGLVPGFKAEEILQLMPELNQYGKIDCFDILNLDSTNLNPQDWQFMAKYIFNLYNRYDGFVLTHGTDTLAWTCCALQYMLKNLAKPIAVIGAQKTIEEANTDAKANLNAAFALAASDKFGVYAICGGQIISGIWAKKLYSEDLRSIQSVNHIPIATFNDYEITWNKVNLTTKPQAKLILQTNLEVKVAQVQIMPGLSPEILQNLADFGYKAIVLIAYGAGGIPNDLTSIIEKLTKRGIIFVCTTQCIYDGVQMNRYEVGIEACKSGVIPAGKLTIEATTVKLMVALGKNYTREQIIQSFAQI